MNLGPDSSLPLPGPLEMVGLVPDLLGPDGTWWILCVIGLVCQVGFGRLRWV